MKDVTKHIALLYVAVITLFIICFYLMFFKDMALTSTLVNYTQPNAWPTLTPS